VQTGQMSSIVLRFWDQDQDTILNIHQQAIATLDV
jgi:hypothetical protein